MKFTWRIEQSDILAVRSIVTQQRNRTFVMDRIESNVNGAPPNISRSKLWQTQLMCLLTSQQRSGPGRPVSNFISEKSFQLSLRTCLEAKNVRSFVYSTLTRFGGIRFADSIATRAAANFEKLESGGWKDLLLWRDKLKTQRLQSPRPSHHQLERQAASYMVGYAEFGPKQSRNVWQALGLTRYEFVLDSRITDWLKKTRFPVPLSATALGDEAYYLFLSEVLREVCVRARVLPCVLDAAIFASYDDQESALEDRQ